MKRIKVKLKERSYWVLIDRNLISRSAKLIKQIVGNFDQAIIITNNLVASYYLKSLKRSLQKGKILASTLKVPDSEKAKSFFYLNRLLNRIAKIAQSKRVIIIALGGGVVGDVAGFVASIYKRGIPYIQIPTTLLAQIDSGIGGKTAIDLSQGKNLAGAIYQPRLVLVDTDYLQSLDKRQIRSGLAEMIKYAIIKNAELFTYLERHIREIEKRQPKYLLPAILACIKIKCQIVSCDELEAKGLRTVLNFGHTVGHAIETASKYRYSHGEAIALGMIVAARISQGLKLTEKKTVTKIYNLIRNSGLPTCIKSLSAEKIFRVTSYDKKFIGKRNRFVLIEDIGSVLLRENIGKDIIIKALEETCARGKML